MPFLMLCAASTLFRVDAAVRPGAAAVPSFQSIDRWEYWLFGPGVSTETGQKWGVVTAPTQEMAQQELTIRQESQRKWIEWVGLKDVPAKDPYSFLNVTGPVAIRSGVFRVPAGITTTNVWIVGLEEVNYRKQITREVAAIRARLEAAKVVQDSLFPIGTNTVVAADLRGKTLYAASLLVQTMAKLREVEAVLQTARGNTLADLSFEVDNLRTRLTQIATQDPIPGATQVASPVTETAAPVSSPVQTPVVAPKEPMKDPAGATVLVPSGSPAPVPTAVVPTVVPTAPKPVQAATTLVPGGAAPTAPSAAPAKTDGGYLAIAELNQRLATPSPSKKKDSTVTAYSFDREGITVRRQVYTGQGLVPQVPERIAFATISDPSKLFVLTADSVQVAYGNSDPKKNQFRSILALPVGTTPDQAQRVVALLKKAISPETEPDTSAPAASGSGVAAVTPEQADAKYSAALSGIPIPAMTSGNDFLPNSLPEWVKVELLGRNAVEMTSKVLAGRYSGKLAEKAQVLDEAGQPTSLALLADAITGEPYRLGSPDRVLWTITSFEDRAGTITMTLQASYVGKSSASSTSRAVHGAKILEVWNAAADGPTIRTVKLIRGGTVLRPVPASPLDLAAGHFESGSTQLADGRPSAALSSLEAALRITPDNPTFWSQYGLALYRVGQNRESLGSYRLARDLDPKNALIVANYSGVLRALGDYPTAITAGKQAVELDGESTWTHEAYALALYAAKDYKSAATEYATAVEKDPKSPRLRANYASALLRSGKKKEAKVQAQQAFNEGFREHWVFAQLGITN